MQQYGIQLNGKIRVGYGDDVIEPFSMVLSGRYTQEEAERRVATMRRNHLGANAKVVEVTD